MGWEKVFRTGRSIQSPTHDTPAVIKGKFDENDGTPVVTKQEWWNHGALHRDHDAPAVIEHAFKYDYHAETWKLTLAKEEYRQHGNLNRKTKPAVIHYSENSKTFEWWNNGTRHRDDAPAVVHCRGNIRQDEWWNNGVKHRLDGPVEYKYSTNNPNIIQPLKFAINGTVIKPGMRVLQAVDTNTPPERLARLTQFHSKVVSTIAAANPNCPEEARTMFALTR